MSDRKKKRKPKKTQHVLMLRDERLGIEGWENMKIKDWDDVPRGDLVIEYKITFPPGTHAVLFNYGVPEP